MPFKIQINAIRIKRVIFWGRKVVTLQHVSSNLFNAGVQSKGTNKKIVL